MAYTFKWSLTKEVVRLSYSCPEIKLNGDFANVITPAFMLLPGMFKRGLGDGYKVLISDNFIAVANNSLHSSCIFNEIEFENIVIMYGIGELALVPVSDVECIGIH